MIFIVLLIGLCITVVLLCQAKTIVAKHVPTIVSNDSKFFKDYNIYRYANGLKPIVCEKLLNELAQEHADYLNEHKPKYLHDGFGDRELLANAHAFAEVCEVRFISPLNAYLNSPKHKQILDSQVYNYIGIGESGDYQCVMFARYD